MENTGNHNVSDRFSTISPAFNFGKGFGDLFELKIFLTEALAVIGVIVPNISAQKTTADVKNPTT